MRRWFLLSPRRFPLCTQPDRLLRTSNSHAVVLVGCRLNHTNGEPHVERASPNALPRRRQIAPGYHFNWRDEVKRSGSPLNDISPAMGDRSRTEEHRQRVAGWTPVVKLLSDQRLRVVIIGRMNGGKSSLFNLLCTDPTIPKKKNIVKDFEGITRDSVEGYAVLNDMHITVIDTPGFVNGSIVEESFRTIETADAILFVAAVDQDITDEEHRLAQFIALKQVPAFLVVNKMDLVPMEREDEVLESYRELGLGNAIPLSTRRREGLDLLAAVVEPLYHLHTMYKVENDWDLEDLALQGDESAMEEIQERNCTDRFIRVAIVGRTNSGKTSLINRLLGFERNRAADEANTTRDPIELPCMYKGRKLKLIDTAGMTRHRYQVDREFLGRLHELTINEIRYAHVVVVVFDALEGHPNKYDMSILHRAAAEGRPFVLCANKWDAVLDQAATAEAVDFKIKRQAREVKYASAVVVSARDGLNLTLLLDHVVGLYDRWNRHVGRGELTRFWRRMERSVIIPHHVPRIGRITQVNTRPPTFRLQLQTKDDSNLLPRAMQEMLKNALIEEYDFKGVPIRLIQDVRDSNPDYI